MAASSGHTIKKFIPGAINSLGHGKTLTMQALSLLPKQFFQQCGVHKPPPKYSRTQIMNAGFPAHPLPSQVLMQFPILRCRPAIKQIH